MSSSVTSPISISGNPSPISAGQASIPQYFPATTTTTPEKLTTKYPKKAKLTHLDRSSNYWSAYNQTWFRLGLFMRAGDEIYQYAGTILQRRSKEPPDLYEARRQIFTYTPFVPQAFSWFISYLFKRDPEITYRPNGSEGKFTLLPATKSAVVAPPGFEQQPPIPANPGTPPPGTPPSPGLPPTPAPLPPAPVVPLRTVGIASASSSDVDPFYNQFRQNCDGAGTSLESFAKVVTESCLIDGSHFILTDLPNTDDYPTPIVSRKDEKDAGLLDAYICHFSAEQAINHSVDSKGNLQWVNFRRYVTRPKQSDLAKGIPAYLCDSESVTQWWHYNADSYSLYEWRQTDASSEATLIRSGPHALSHLPVPRVPVRRIEFPERLWLGKRVILAIVRHINLENQLAWQILQCAVPWLVVYTESRNPKNWQRSEVNGMILKAGDRAEYLEPHGNSMAIMVQQLETIKEDIFSLLHLKSQGRSSSATPAVQSGTAKLIDMMPSHEIATEIGSFIRMFLRNILIDVMDARSDKLQPEVLGFDYEDSGYEFLLDEAIKESTIPVLSPSYLRERAKMLIRSGARTKSPDEIKRFELEIDANMTDEVINALITKIVPAQGAIREGEAQSGVDSDEQDDIGLSAS